MPIDLETDLETATETDTTEEIRIEPSLIENRVRLFQLLSKRNNPVQRVESIERQMALFDPNGS